MQRNVELGKQIATALSYAYVRDVPADLERREDALVVFGIRTEGRSRKKCDGPSLYPVRAQAHAHAHMCSRPPPPSLVQLATRDIEAYFKEFGASWIEW